MDNTSILDLAIRYATEGLFGREREDFEAWVGGAPRSEGEDFAAVVDGAGALSLALPQFAPPADAKARLMERLFGQASKKEERKDAASRSLEHEHAHDHSHAVPEANVGPEFSFIDAESGAWTELPVKGARIKELADHAEDNYTIFVLELDPGTAFPAHNHRGSEAAIVLSGDLRIEGHVLGPGGYSRAAPGTRHHDLYSEHGCRALLVTARENFPRHTLHALSGVSKAVKSIGKLFGRDE